MCEHTQGLELLYEDYEPLDLEVPYIPGFLAFREVSGCRPVDINGHALRRIELSQQVPAYLKLLSRAARTNFNPQV